MDRDLADLLDDLAGFAWIPGFGGVVDSIRTAAEAAAAGQLTTDQTQTGLALCGNPNGPDLIQALALLAKSLTNPATNLALAGMDDDTRKTVQLLGELHAHDTAEYGIREHTNEAAGLIYETTLTTGRGCTQMSRLTDDDRKELSEKAAKANKQSTNRPR
jgi:hypothetical protein